MKWRYDTPVSKPRSTSAGARWSANASSANCTRLRGFDFARLLITGTEAEVRQHRYRSSASPKSVLHSLYAFEVRYGVPVVWAGTPAQAVTLVERWAFWYAREIRKAADGIAATRQEVSA